MDLCRLLPNSCLRSGQKQIVPNLFSKWLGYLVKPRNLRSRQLRQTAQPSLAPSATLDIGDLLAGTSPLSPGSHLKPHPHRKACKRGIHFPLKESPLQHQNNEVKLGVRTGKCRYGCAYGNVM
jgi:hypothetical protein